MKVDVIRTLWLLAILAGALGMGNHLYICFTLEKYILLIAGVIAPPIGSLHGLGNWFGLW